MQGQSKCGTVIKKTLFGKYLFESSACKVSRHQADLARNVGRVFFAGDYSEFTPG